MEKGRVYCLWDKKRFVEYPYPLLEVGWLPEHVHIHKNNRIDGCFVCLSANSESLSETIVNGVRVRQNPSNLPHFSIVRPGTMLNTIHASCHDELFFKYSAETGEKVLSFLGPWVGEESGFFFSSFPEEIISEIRAELARFDEPGTADRLDQLAIRLFTEILIRRGTASRSVRANRMKIHSIASELEKGGDLALLLRKFAIGERSFYREWAKVFPVSPSVWRTERMLAKACALLRESDLPPVEIAAECGFSGTVYFYQLFRKHFNTTPGLFRKAEHGRLFPGGC